MVVTFAAYHPCPSPAKAYGPVCVCARSHKWVLRGSHTDQATRKAPCQFRTPVSTDAASGVVPSRHHGNRNPNPFPRESLEGKGLRRKVPPWGGRPLGSGRQLPPQLTVGRRPLGGGGGGGGGARRGGVWEGVGFWEGVVLVGAPGRAVPGGGGGCRAPPNSWVCGPGVIRQFAPPLPTIEGRVSSAWVFPATLGTSGGWAPEAAMGLELHHATRHTYRHTHTYIYLCATIL